MIPHITVAGVSFVHGSMSYAYGGGSVCTYWHCSVLPASTFFNAILGTGLPPTYSIEPCTTQFERALQTLACLLATSAKSVIQPTK